MSGTTISVPIMSMLTLSQQTGTTGQLAFVILLSSVLLGYYWGVGHSRVYRYPPGPPTHPLIGNILDVPVKAAWLKFTEYKRIYGDLVFFRGLGNNILVLNSREAINDLFDKRANNYSHRPRFVMAGEMIGIDQSMILLPYGEEWRAQRKLAHVALSPSAVQTYHPMLEELAVLLGQALLRKPEDFINHVQLASARIILAVTYGISTASADDGFIDIVEKHMVMVNKCMRPGVFLCDLIPIFKYAPSWVSFKKEVELGKALLYDALERPYNYVKHEMAAGTARPSLTQQLLSQGVDNGDPAQFEHRLKWTANTMYSAGTETTFATVTACILVMTLYPQKQHLAQEEIDNVIGTENLPLMADRSRLPYVNAFIKELMRWHPVVPLGVAHQTQDDDEYKGYFIPKSTVVIPNVWAIAFAPDEKYDPHDFIPERFLDPTHSTPDPHSWAFGFSRRICPGKALAEDAVFILVTTILAVFQVSPRPGIAVEVQSSPYLPPGAF